MYAEIHGSEANKFKAFICDGGVYILKKFVVSTCKSAYKPFQSEQMIRFTPWTTVHQRNDLITKMPKYVFDLVDFQQFPSRVGVVDCFIGELHLALTFISVLASNASSLLTMFRFQIQLG
jgi:hypothetical protein